MSDFITTCVAEESGALTARIAVILLALVLASFGTRGDKTALRVACTLLLVAAVAMRATAPDRCVSAERHNNDAQAHLYATLSNEFRAPEERVSLDFHAINDCVDPAHYSEVCKPVANMFE